MGKKKKRGQKDTQIICYYCDRTFIDETTLILHQRAKHFKCGECHKKMTTAPSLAVHCTHVHKTVLKGVPGALPGREAIDLEIFGMAGIPEEFGQEEDLAEPQGLDEEQRAKMARLAAPPLPAGQAGTLPPSSYPAYFAPRPQSWQHGEPALTGGAPLTAPGYPYGAPYGHQHYPHMPPHFLPPRPTGFMPPGLPNSMPFGGQLPGATSSQAITCFLELLPTQKL